MDDFIVAVGLVFVIEGLLYAAFPGAMRKMILDISNMPENSMRVAGLAALVFGLVVVWMVRG